MSARCPSRRSPSWPGAVALSALAWRAIVDGLFGTSAIYAALTALAVSLGRLRLACPRSGRPRSARGSWPRPATAGQGAGCAAPALATAGYREPSLVFLGGTDLAMTDGEGAARFLAQSPCRIAFVVRSMEPQFIEAAAQRGAHPAPDGAGAGPQPQWRAPARHRRLSARRLRACSRPRSGSGRASPSARPTPPRPNRRTRPRPSPRRRRPPPSAPKSAEPAPDARAEGQRSMSVTPEAGRPPRRRASAWWSRCATSRTMSARWSPRSRPRARRFAVRGRLCRRRLERRHAGGPARTRGDRPWLRCIRHAQSCGQSAAVRTGVRAARAPIVVTIDGDGQNDPAYIPALVAALEAAGPRRRAGRRPAPRAQGHGLQEAAVARRQRRALARPQGRHPRHRLRPQGRAPRGLSRRCPISTRSTASCRPWSRREGYEVVLVDVVDRPRLTGRLELRLLRPSLGRASSTSPACGG